MPEEGTVPWREMSGARASHSRGPSIHAHGLEISPVTFGHILAVATIGRTDSKCHPIDDRATRLRLGCNQDEEPRGANDGKASNDAPGGCAERQRPFGLPPALNLLWQFAAEGLVQPARLARDLVQQERVMGDVRGTSTRSMHRHLQVSTL